MGTSFYFGFLFLIAELFGEEDFAIRSLFNFFERRGSLYSEIAEVNQLIQLEEKRIEDQKELNALKTVAAIEAEMLARRVEMLAIEEVIKYKRKWRAEFDDFPNVLEQNQKLDEVDASLIRQNVQDIRRSHPEFSKWSNRYLPFSFGYRNYEWLKWRLEKLRSGEPQDFDARDHVSQERSHHHNKGTEIEIENIADLSNESSVSKDGSKSGIEPIHSPNSKTNTSEKSVRTDKPDLPNPRHGQTTSRDHSGRFGQPQPLLFDELSLSQRPLTEIPTQQIRLPKLGIFKISDKLRRQVNAQKLEIGKLGELAIVIMREIAFEMFVIE